MPIIGEVAGSQKTPPDAPGIVSATDVGTGRAYNNGAVTVVLSAPTYTGRLPITSYTVTPSSGSASFGASTTQTLTGFLSATNYTFTANATNAVGNSPTAGPTGSVFVTTVPQAPTITSTTAGNGQVTVFYSAGASGGKTISTYTVTSNPGGITATGSGTNATVTGLTNGTPYTFTVTATNANGVSAPSAASSPVTPVQPSFWNVNYPGQAGGYGAAGGGVNTSTNEVLVVGGRAVYSIGMKLNSAGTYVSQRQLNNFNTGNQLTSGYVWDACVSPAGYIYIAGDNNFSGSSRALVQKWDSNFNSVYSIRSNASQGYGCTGRRIHVDSADCAYLGYYAPTYYSAWGYFNKYNSNGTVAWQKVLGSDCVAPDITTDSANNVYAAYTFLANLTDTKPRVQKYNSSGTWQTTRRFQLSDTSIGVTPGPITTDASDYIYLTCFYQTSFTLIKLDSSLNIVWQRTINPGALPQLNPQQITVGPSGNIYISCTRGYGNILVFKYNSSGTLLWHREAPSNWITGNLQEVGTDLYMFLQSSVTAGSFCLKVPADGSKTGTYTAGGVSITWQAGSYTDSAGAFGSVTTGQDGGTQSWAHEGVTPATAATSLTSYTTVF